MMNSMDDIQHDYFDDNLNVYLFVEVALLLFLFIYFLSSKREKVKNKYVISNLSSILFFYFSPSFFFLYTYMYII